MLKTKTQNKNLNLKKTPVLKLKLVEPDWSQEKYVNFYKEIEKIGNEAYQKIGKEDVVFLKKLLQQSRFCNVVGRVLIQFSIDPVTWMAGILFFAVHREIELNTLGHHVGHGVWDRLPEVKDYHSNNYHPFSLVDKAAWQISHNIYHHSYTNIAGMDPDNNDGFMRLSRHTPWSWIHLLQPFYFFFSAPLFSYLTNFHTYGLFRRTRDTNRARAMAKNILGPKRGLQTWLKKFLKANFLLARYSAYQYFLWPLLSGPLFLKASAGYLLADFVANSIICATVFTNHFNEDLAFYGQDFKTRNKGEWFRHQIESSQNFTVSSKMNVIVAFLNYQIEHHLFPSLPPNRFAEVAPKIKSVCKKYGVKYASTDFFTALYKSIYQLCKYALP